MLTPKQERVREILANGGGAKDVMQALGNDERAARRIIQRTRSVMASKGEATEYEIDRPVPDILKMSGLSDMRRNSDGLPIWYKFSKDQHREAEMMREAIEALCEEIPAAPPAPPSLSKACPDLLNLYVITDYHLGMLAWGEETGEDWDIEIAEDLLVRWFKYAIEHSPPADVGYFAQIGDFLHWDGLDAVTPASKHLLDADTRFGKLVRTVIRVIRRVIGMLLEKYPTVVVLMADANHDPASSVWLREFLAAHYDEDPRVVVDRNADTYYAYQHGKTALFFHHGHKRKPANISEVFAAKYRQMFGETQHAYAHMGHLHHIDVKENPLMVVEQHRTLAANDAYASRGGWLSGRSSPVITYHREHGEVSRLVVSPQMVA